ncbi:immunity 17 family protein [Psychroserpens jangbogonensis]|uniref:immunity 17 family protein n=1 Tax=Psychroserpens jangbogonensis TaxID=1484460 RepID=UPI00053EC964|nr:immunity 17 family protein [Psychroserpens jangbogonensis]
MEDNKELIALIISIGAGAFSIIASILNWDFFFENRKAEFLVNILGRNGSRIFYAILGLFLFFIAYKISSK